MNVRKAVIPTAGLGTRFLPVTKAVPKALLPVLDTPVIHLAVEEAAAAGIERVVMVVSPNQDAISAYFDVSSDVARMLERQGKSALIERVSDLAKTVEITYVQQREPLGNGHAVLVAKEAVGNEPIAVLLPDDVIRGSDSTIGRMIDIYERPEGRSLAWRRPRGDDSAEGSRRAHEPKRQGVRDIGTRREAVRSRRPRRTWPSWGRYVLPPEIFAALERTSPGAGGEIWLADGIAALLKTHRGTAFRFPGELFDTGVPAGMLKASIREALERDDMSDEIRAYIRDLAT